MQKALFISLLFGTMLILGSIWYSFNGQEFKRLPLVLGEVQLLVSEQSDGFREGCAVSIYELSPAVAQKLMSEGLQYLGNDNVPRSAEREDTTYSAWAKTPAPSHNYAEKALTCSERLRKHPELQKMTAKIAEALQGEHGFFILTKNGEGMILVMPTERLVAFLYYG